MGNESVMTMNVRIKVDENWAGSQADEKRHKRIGCPVSVPRRNHFRSNLLLGFTFTILNVLMWLLLDLLASDMIHL